MTRAEILEIAKPILFNTDMVRAILEDRKSMTRRLVKFLGTKNPNWTGYIKDGLWLYNGRNEPCNRPPRYKVGDYLYIRETWGCYTENWGDASYFLYRADYPDGATTYQYDDHTCDIPKWRPSIHMPKEAARIFLKVTDVRMERLRDISEEQAIHEGICRLYDHLSDDEYSAWASRIHINAQKSEWGWKNYLWHGHFGKHGTGNAITDAWEYQYSSYDDPVESFSSLWNSTLPLNQWNKYGWNANPWVFAYEFERVKVSNESISV